MSGKMRRKGVTLIELLVVIGIIGVLAGFSLAVGRSLQAKARRDATEMLIAKIETGLEGHYEGIGYYPQSFLDAIPTQDELEALTGTPEEIRQATAERMVEGNQAVASVLRGIDEFSADGGAHASEIVKDAGKHYVVDAWFDVDRPEHDLSGLADGEYSYLNILRNGWNRPGLDIWSNGPDGMPHDRDPDDFAKYGDDVVNWGRK